MNAAEAIAAAIEKLTSTDEPPIGSIVIDAEGGWPWVRTAGGQWTRDAGATFLTWDEVRDWHQMAVDDPDDEAVEPFHPVVLNYGNDKPLPLIDVQIAILREAHGAVTEYPEKADELYRWELDLARAILGEVAP